MFVFNTVAIITLPYSRVFNAWTLFSLLDSFAVIKSMSYLLHDKNVSHDIPAAIYVSFIEVSTLLHLDLVGWRLHICLLHSQLLCTLQLLSNCCTPNSIISMIATATYTLAKMCFFISIHSIKHSYIACQESKHFHDVIYSHDLF